MTSLVVIDSRVAGFSDTLLSLGADAKVVLLDPQSDGIEQILNALQGVTDLSAIHIVSHGSSGTLYLGSTVLTDANLSDYGAELANIGGALAPQGDVMLYGCDVAAGDDGQNFIHHLAQLTGADVAASTDLTGAATLGGNWVLEASAGAIEAQALAPAEFAALLAAPVVTAAGTLDTSFDTDGSLTTDFGAGGAIATSVALQVDGKIVAAGYNYNGVNNDFALARYNANGSLDTSFDTDGKLTTVFGAGSAATGVALQSDGKIVVAGYTFDGASTYDFALARYNGSDGSLDTTFSGDGKATVVFGGIDNSARSVILQTDGKIVVAGYAYNGASYDFALARYDTNGNADAAFSGDGKQTTSFGTGDDFINSIALQTDGKIVAAGYSYNGTNNDFALARYNTDGSLDTTFDADGKVTTDFGGAGDIASSVALQSDGKIVVAGYSFNGTNYDFALARYNVNGSLDTTFDGDGKVTTAFGTGNDVAFSVALQSDGKIVVAGDFVDTNREFAIARYNVDGSLDTSFSGDGKLAIAIGINAGATSMALQADGAIVAAGSGLAGGNTDFALVRVVGGPGIPDVAIKQGVTLGFAVNATTFTDPDGDVLSYAATLANGSALPAWLHFDAGTRTFSGTPGLGNVGSLSVKVTATDTTAASTSDVFTLAVTNLIASTGDDLLYGGTSADTMTGLQGNDTYIVDNAGDIVVEATGQGTDTVLASISYALPANVENLNLTGSAAINGTGNELNNVLTGNSGNNILDGGLGVDTAVYSSARGGYVVTKAGLNETVSGPDGTDTLTGIERLQFSDGLMKLGSPAVDPSGDGKSDLLWRSTGGEVVIWQMDGLTRSGAASFGTVPTSWTLQDGHGDYNGDGKSDLLWRSANGEVVIWQMDGLTRSGAASLGTVPTSWSLQDGHGDYNGDGKSDLLWRNTNGEVVIWQMDGLTRSGAASLGTVPTSWSVEDGHGDYNGDGKSDLLWRSTGGEVVIWQMDGLTRSGAASLGTVPTDWTVQDGHGDYNGDGKSDLLWRSTGGEVVIWQMDGLTRSGAASLGTVPTSWTLQDGHGDYNGDGKSDLLWRSANGEVVIWQMDGLTRSGAASLGTVPTDWTVQDSHGDYNGDGKSDIVWRNTSGEVVIWQMDGLTRSGAASLGTVPTSWGIVDGTESGATLTGDSGNNTLVGTAESDTLAGLDGNDTLTGNAGADKFVFNTALNASANVDTVTDFASGTDKLVLDHLIFSALSAGDVPAGSFVAEANATAHDVNQHILYDTTTGNLSYDPDGSGAQAATQFANLANHPALAVADLAVV